MCKGNCDVNLVLPPYHGQTLVPMMRAVGPATTIILELNMARQSVFDRTNGS